MIFFFHLSNPCFNSCRILSSTKGCLIICHRLTLHCVSRLFPDFWDLSLGNFFDAYCFLYHRKEWIVISNVFRPRAAKLNCTMCGWKKEAKWQLLASKLTSKEHQQPRNLPLCQQSRPRSIVCSSYLRYCGIVHDLHFHIPLLHQYIYLSEKVCSSPASSFWNCLWHSDLKSWNSRFFCTLRKRWKGRSIKHMKWFWGVWYRRGWWMFWQMNLAVVRDMG